MSILTVNKIKSGTYECVLDLDKLFNTSRERDSFEAKWEDFMNSDKWNLKVLNRSSSKIFYPHKSWIPEKEDSRKKVLIIAGNPAPQSVAEDIYYAFETNGIEHRFWKVLRSLEIIDLKYNFETMKQQFFDLDYVSPFIVGIEAAFTFPSPASAPKWSGVQGLIKLFGSKAFQRLYEEEKLRIRQLADSFFKNENGAIIAMQKHAYEAFANGKYNVNSAVAGTLVDNYSSKVKAYGTPPTRWLYTKKMRGVLTGIKNEIVG